MDGKVCLGTFGEQLTGLKRNVDSQERTCSNGVFQMMISANVEEYKMINIYTTYIAHRQEK